MEENIAEIEKNFRSRDLYERLPEYSLMPGWCLAGKMDATEIERQLEEFKKKHISQIYIFPCCGLEVEYLSEEYFEWFRHICEKAREIGVRIWIWDEYNWPSGIAGGKLLKDYPQYSSKYLRYYAVETGTGLFEMDVAEGHVVFAGAYSEKKEFVDLRNAITSRRLSWNVPDGRWQLFVFVSCTSQCQMESSVGAPWTRGTKGYLDTLNKEAARTFIELTYEAYYSHLKDYFGETIYGFFTDEPAMMYDFELANPEGEHWREILNAKTFPWTDNITETFKQIKGYGLEENLPKLLETYKDAKVRQDFWEVASKMYSESFHGQIREWCKDHKVQYMGHLFSEEPVEKQIKYEGDMAKSLAEFDIPGIDHLGRGAGYNAEILPKVILSSIAEKKGTRAMVEDLAASDYSIALSDMGRVTDFLIAMKTNLFTPQPYFYTMRGFLKRLGSATMFHQQPYWKYHQEYSDFVTRSCYLATRGKGKAKVGVVYPFGKFVSEVSMSGKQNDEFTRTRNSLGTVVETLMRNQIEFELVFEDELEQIRTKYEKIIDVSGKSREDIEMELTKWLATSRTALNRGIAVFEGDILSSEFAVWSRKVDDAVICAVMNMSDKELKAEVVINNDGKTEIWDPVTGDVTEPDGLVAFPANKLLFFVVRKDRKRKMPVYIACRETKEIKKLSGEIELELVPHNVYKIRNFQVGLNKIEWATAPENVIPEKFVKNYRYYLKAEIPVGDYESSKSCIVFEKGRVEGVGINGRYLGVGKPVKWYDESLSFIPVSGHLQKGENVFECEYSIPPYEIETRSSGYFYNFPKPVIDPIFLVGDFCVIDNKICKKIEKFGLGNLATQGCPDFFGVAKISIREKLAREETKADILKIDVFGHSCEVKINGKKIGILWREPYMLEIPDGALVEGENVFEIETANTLSPAFDGKNEFGVKEIALCRAE